ncbi:MAG TPA: hypothetical protein VJ837_05835, partial [Candidatus Paceibacterota bacterium]|nr:hypothetical protein [Candidatus Paceibacterota bacterium]
PVFRLLEGISNDDGEFALRTTFKLERDRPKVPEGTFEESLQRSTLIGSALGAAPASGQAPDLDAIAELTSLDVDGFAQAMVSGGPAWYKNTASYLSNRANLLDKQQKAQEALNEFWSYSRQSAEGNPTLLASISEQFIESASDWTNAVANVNGELAAPRDASIQIPGLDTYAKRKSFWDSVITGLDAALSVFIGTAHASETRAAAEKAISNVKAAAQTVLVRPGTSHNPLDNASFNPDSSIPTATLKEGQVATYTAYLPYETRGGGQRINLQLSGTSASQLRVVDRTEEITPDASGSFVLTVAEGAREVSFGLWAKEDVDANDTLTLSATLTDAAGVATHKTHTELVLTVRAVEEADAGV